MESRYSRNPRSNLPPCEMKAFFSILGIANLSFEFDRSVRVEQARDPTDGAQTRRSIESNFKASI